LRSPLVVIESRQGLTSCRCGCWWVISTSSTSVSVGPWARRRAP